MITDKIICYCNNISESTIKQAIASGANNLNDVILKTSAGRGNNCKEMNPTGQCCIPEIKKLLNNSENPSRKCSCCS